MKFTGFLLAIALVLSSASAETVLVTLGNTGCVGRQIAVQQLWEKIPGVVSVTILAPEKGNHGPTRTFVIVSDGKAPDRDAFTTALGRRAHQYPLLDLKSAKDR